MSKEYTLPSDGTVGDIQMLRLDPGDKVTYASYLEPKIRPCVFENETNEIIIIVWRLRISICFGREVKSWSIDSMEPFKC